MLGGVDKPGRGGTGLKYRLIAATSRGCTVEEDATKLLPAFYLQPSTLLTSAMPGLAAHSLTRLSTVALLRAAPDGSWLVSLVANRGEDVPRTSGL